MTNTPRRGSPQVCLVGHRNPTGITVESSPSLEGVGLLIEYTDTADMDDGQSLPPFIDEGGAIWHVVNRLPGGYARWRRIRIGLLSDQRPIPLGRAISHRAAADKARHEQRKPKMDMKEHLAGGIKPDDVQHDAVRIQSAAIKQGKCEKPDLNPTNTPDLRKVVAEGGKVTGNEA